MRRFFGAHAKQSGDLVHEGGINTGLVLDFKGVELTDGMVVVTWCRPSSSQPHWEFYPNFARFQDSHSGDGTVIYWVDPPMSECG